MDGHIFSRWFEEEYVPRVKKYIVQGVYNLKLFFSNVDNAPANFFTSQHHFSDTANESACFKEAIQESSSRVTANDRW